MNAEDLAYWKKVTANSAHFWTYDHVRSTNNDMFLFYKGGEDGVYVMIESNGKATAGQYEGAIPHIGDALFKAPTFTRQFASKNEAFTRISEKLGTEFFMALTHGQSPLASH